MADAVVVHAAPQPARPHASGATSNRMKWSTSSMRIVSIRRWPVHPDGETGRVLNQRGSFRPLHRRLARRRSARRG